MAQRPKISSSHPQVSPKVVGNGKRTRIEALLVARFDTEDLADERLTSMALYKTARNKCQRNRFSLFVVQFYKKKLQFMIQWKKVSHE